MYKLEELRKVAPKANRFILKGIVDNNHLFRKYDVTTPRRLRYFMAQVAHESAGFRTTREYASGRAYEGRRDLGNINPGDGVKYKGRGLIQLTGRYNYRLYGRLMGVDIENDPIQAERFPLALEIALAYWQQNDLNTLADAGKFRLITKRINGGYRGMLDRLSWLRKFKALG